MIQILEWLPFHVLFLWDVVLFIRRTRAPLPAKAPRSVSVIIPTRNEEERIEACIEAIRQDDAVHEVIVVDGGSTDRTAALAAGAGAMVIHGSADPEKGGGRGGQINAGLAPARGDIAAVVHADSLAPPGVFSAVRDILARDATVAGGAIGCVFSSSAPLMRLVEAANDFRAVFLGVSFGDQVQFFRREPVVRQALFPAIPLMEDVEFCPRLSRLGRRVFLFGEVRVSARRWKKTGYGNFISIPLRVAAYLWRRLWGDVDVLAMHRAYYSKEKQPETMNRKQ